jgi:DNA-binding beta-propeller fold protein YncE
VVSTLAGTGAQGSANGVGATATFNDPLGVAVDSGGNLYVADSGNNKIRRITPLGIVSTFAGTGESGSTDGAPGNVAQLESRTRLNQLHCTPLHIVIDADVALRGGNALVPSK